VDQVMERNDCRPNTNSDRNLLRLLVALLVLTTPAMMLIVPGASTPLLGLIVLAGMVVLARCWTEFRADWLNSPQLTLFTLLLLAHASVAAASHLLVDSSAFAGNRFGRQLILLSIPVVFAALWWARPSLKAVGAGIAINAVVLGIHTTLAFAKGQDRGEGVVHMVLLGNSALLLGFASLALVFLKSAWPWRFLGLAGFAFGLIGSLLSQSRGGWIAVPILLAVSFVALRRHYRPSVRGLVVTVVALTAGAAMLSQTTVVEERIAGAERDLQRLVADDFETAIGWRVLMWRIAFETGLQAPLFGQGFGAYQTEVDARLQRGEIPPSMSRFRTEPHSDYLQVFATRGLLGLTVFGTLLLVPLVYLFGRVVRGTGSEIFAAQIGLSLVLVVAIGGLSITMIDQRPMIRFLVVISALTLYALWFARTRGTGVAAEKGP
jgi:O-antigen ligase